MRYIITDTPFEQLIYNNEMANGMVVIVHKTRRVGGDWDIKVTPFSYEQKVEINRLMNLDIRGELI